MHHHSTPGPQAGTPVPQGWAARPPDPSTPGPSESGSNGTGATSIDPATISPSIPSTFLSAGSVSAPSSIITSVSRNSKRKHDHHGHSEGPSNSGHGPASSNGGASKRSRPLSVAAKAQKESCDELVRFNNIFETFAGKFNDAQSTPNPEYAHAIKLLRDDGAAMGLSPQQRMDIGSFLGKNPKEVTLYVNNDAEVRALWLQKILSTLESASTST